MLLPSGLPEVAVFQHAHHTKLRVLMPPNLVCLAPCTHFQVACVGKAIAGFLVGMQTAKRGLLPNAVEYIRQLACVYFKAATLYAQRIV